MLKPCSSLILRSISAEDEPSHEGPPEPRLIGTNCLVDRGDPKALAFARAEAQPVDSGPITRVSNRAAATFNYEGLGYAVLSTAAAPQPARTGCLFLNLVEVPALRLDGVDVQIGNIDVTCAQTFGRQLARIGATAGVGDLVSASM
jgi:hypothetical protein